MGTQVRDALVTALVKAGAEQFDTAEGFAKRYKLEVSSAAQALRDLAKRKIAVRRKNGKSFEYAVGPRAAYGEKYAGRRFPFHHRTEHVNGETIPATGGMAGIVIRLEGTAHAITLAEAKTLFNELKSLFG